ncbi:hypothetical protein CEXT_332371 [Caerostris extrusa]|uniref:Transmembrane protein n=1 Tax=Caerostris extrusa TaxID=172846 RepID=A0AAV4RIS0_CAEEX|nr:hypothetical protein CEXT_332371 [Caerostris extrusa]
MAHPHHSMNRVQETSFIEETVVLPIPPPPIVPELNIPVCSLGHPESKLSSKKQTNWCRKTVKITAYVLTGTALFLIIFSPVLHTFLGTSAKIQRCMYILVFLPACFLLKRCF